MGWRRRSRSAGASPAAAASEDESPAPATPPPPVVGGVHASETEAQDALRALRVRHWSAETLLEESRTGVPWWDHPLADPYAVLGLLPGAPVEEAAAARRRVAARCHPDVAHDDGMTRRLVAANAAYARISEAVPAGARRASGEWSDGTSPLLTMDQPAPPPAPRSPAARRGGTGGPAEVAGVALARQLVGTSLPRWAVLEHLVRHCGLEPEVAEVVLADVEAEAA